MQKIWHIGLALSGAVLAFSASNSNAAPHEILTRQLYEENQIVEVEINGDNWDALKNQDPEGGLCNFAFLGDRYDWFAFDDIKVNGEIFKNVGIRKKSWCGSESKTKPSLTIKIDKFDKEMGDLAEATIGDADLVLNNSFQDASLIRQCFAYQIFSRLGVPAPLCNFAHVTVNGQDMGIYVNLQPTKKSFIEMAFEGELGNLYEVPGSNFELPYLSWYAAGLDSYHKPEDESLRDVEGLINLLSHPTTGHKAISTKVDLALFMRFWAGEILLTHNDGFALGNTNSYIYFPAVGGMQVLPAGTDRILSETGDRETLSIYQTNLLARRLVTRAEPLTMLKAQLNEFLSSTWREDDLLRKIDRTAAILRPYLAWHEKDAFELSLSQLKTNLRNRRAQLQIVLGGRYNVHLQNKAQIDFCMNTQYSGDQAISNVFNCSEHQDQKWDIRSLGNEYSQLRNIASGNCINLQGDTDGTVVGAWPCARHPDQTWKAVLNEGYYNFVSQRVPNKCLTMLSPYNAAALTISTCNNKDDRQKWLSR